MSPLSPAVTIPHHDGAGPAVRGLLPGAEQEVKQKSSIAGFLIFPYIWGLTLPLLNMKPALAPDCFVQLFLTPFSLPCHLLSEEDTDLFVLGGARFLSLLFLFFF